MQTALSRAVRCSLYEHSLQEHSVFRVYFKTLYHMSPRFCTKYLKKFVDFSADADFSLSFTGRPAAAARRAPPRSARGIRPEQGFRQAARRRAAHASET